MHVISTGVSKNVSSVYILSAVVNELLLWKFNVLL